MLKTVGERKVKFVLCAESGLGKLHIMKNGTMSWRGRQWSQVVLGGVPKGGQTQKVSAIVGRGLDSPQHSLFQAELKPSWFEVGESPTSDKCSWSAMMA